VFLKKIFKISTQFLIFVFVGITSNVSQEPIPMGVIFSPLFGIIFLLTILFLAKENFEKKKDTKLKKISFEKLLLLIILFLFFN
jgi:hypothetical protein